MNETRDSPTNPCIAALAGRAGTMNGGPQMDAQLDFGRVVTHAPRADQVGTGGQGFMRQNMELDVVNHSPVGRDFAVKAKNFGLVRVALVDGPPSTFTRAR